MQIGILVPILRQILQVAGGALIANGYLDQSAADALSGVFLNLAVFGWWFYDRSRINATKR